MLKNFLAKAGFITPSEAPKVKATEPTTGKVEVATPPANYYQNTQQSTQLAGPEIVTKMRENFVQILETANFPGTDFLEFYKSKQLLSSIPMEDQKYQTAFSIVKAQDPSIDKQKLITTGNQYIEVIDKEMKEFEATYNTAVETQVTAKRTLSQQKASEMVRLSEQIRKLDEEVHQLNGEASQTENDLASKKTTFMMTGEHFKQELVNEIAKIEAHIQ